MEVAWMNAGFISMTWVETWILAPSLDSGSLGQVIHMQKDVAGYMFLKVQSSD